LNCLLRSLLTFYNASKQITEILSRNWEQPLTYISLISFWITSYGVYFCYSLNKKIPPPTTHTIFKHNRDKLMYANAETSLVFPHIEKGYLRHKNHNLVWQIWGCLLVELIFCLFSQKCYPPECCSVLFLPFQMSWLLGSYFRCKFMSSFFSWQF